MRLKEVNEKIKDQFNYIAVYDELLAVLAKSIEGKLKIPTSTDDEFVESVYVEAVRDHLQEIRTDHEEQVRKLEELEVQGGRREVRDPPIRGAYVIRRTDRPDST